MANGAGTAELELRHWRPVKRVSSGMQGRWAPPEIDIPNGNGQAGYTSLRDILSSPEYAAAKASSPSAAGGGGGGGCCGDVHMIRHPLVKHAACAYLQLTPSAREDAGRRRRRRQGPLCRLLVGCLGFIGALFGRDGELGFFCSMDGHDQNRMTHTGKLRLRGEGEGVANWQKSEQGAHARPAQTETKGFGLAVLAGTSGASCLRTAAFPVACTAAVCPSLSGGAGAEPKQWELTTAGGCMDQMCPEFKM